MLFRQEEKRHAEMVIHKGDEQHVGKGKKHRCEHIDKRKGHEILQFMTFYGCGGRTRTYDLRVMSCG